MNNTKLIGIIVYASALVLIFLFPPVESVTYSYSYASYGNSITKFAGWDFISEVDGDYQINIILLLIEITIVTLIYGSFLYFTKNNK